MAIKGNAYTKTTWAFQERPVTSSKLNSWDDRIEAALELAHFLLVEAWGGADGVVRGAATNDLAVTETAPVGMSVDVDAGYAFVSRFPFKLGASLQTSAFVAPTTNPRIDLVQADLATWGITIKQGTEAASPVAPAVDADAVVLAEVFLRVGMTSVKDVDDSTNGYITDVRSFV